MIPRHLDALERGSREHYDDPGYYDYTYRRRKDDIAFYRRMARQWGGPVLELGGGSGRVSIPIATDGYKVTLLDASSAMLERAGERADQVLDRAARRRLSLVCGDMREFSLKKCTFGLIIAPFNVLLHLYEPADFAKCFSCLVRHLAPGGRFVFDARVPHLGELARNPERVFKGRPFRHPTLGYRVEYTESFRYDPLKQVQHVTMRFVPAQPTPRGARTVEVLLSQRQIFPNELRALLALGGLTLDKRFGDFSGKPLGEDDLFEVVVAKRATP